MKAYTSVVVPAFNEADGLPARLETLCAYLERRFSDEYELVVIDDGSTDATADVLEAACVRYPRIRVINHERNRGLNAAVRTGVAASRGARIVVLDADLTYAPQIAGELVDALENGAQVATASPYMRGGSCRGVPLLRLYLSRWANRYLSLAVKGRLRTLTCMVRAYEASLAAELLEEHAFDECTFGVLLHAYRAGAAITEVPAVLDWSEQPPSRARRIRLKNIIRHTAIVLAAGARTRPLLIAGAPGLFPGILPLATATAVALHGSPLVVAKVAALTLIVQCASLSLLTFHVGTFLRRTHVHRTVITTDAT